MAKRKIKAIEETRGGKLFGALVLGVILLAVYWENGGTIEVCNVDVTGILVLLSTAVLAVLGYAMLYIRYLLEKQ